MPDDSRLRLARYEVKAAVKWAVQVWKDALATFALLLLLLVPVVVVAALVSLIVSVT